MLGSGKSLNFLALSFWGAELSLNPEPVAAATFLPWTMLSPSGVPPPPGLPSSRTWELGSELWVARGCPLLC